MKKKIIILAVVLLLIGIGVFSINISVGDFFFTTKYYKTPIKAYNATATHSAVLGDTSAESELGLVSLDDENCLFIGALYEERFVVCEMEKKNDRYASKGDSFFFDFIERDTGDRFNEMKIGEKTVYWTIVYDQEKVKEIEATTDGLSVESFVHPNGKTFYFLMQESPGSSENRQEG